MLICAIIKLRNRLERSRMKIYKDLLSLQENSILVPDGTVAVSPEGEYRLDVSWASREKWHYCVKNAVVAYIMSEGELYVTPITWGVQAFLNGRFAEGDFPVPFSDGAYPKEERRRWASLLREAYIENLKWKEGFIF